MRVKATNVCFHKKNQKTCQWKCDHSLKDWKSNHCDTAEIKVVLFEDLFDPLQTNN